MAELLHVALTQTPRHTDTHSRTQSFSQAFNVHTLRIRHFAACRRPKLTHLTCILFTFSHGSESRNLSAIPWQRHAGIQLVADTYSLVNWPKLLPKVRQLCVCVSLYISAQFG